MRTVALFHVSDISYHYASQGCELNTNCFFILTFFAGAILKKVINLCQTGNLEKANKKMSSTESNHQSFILFYSSAFLCFPLRLNFIAPTRNLGAAPFSNAETRTSLRNMLFFPGNPVLYQGSYQTSTECKTVYHFHLIKQTISNFLTEI